MQLEIFENEALNYPIKNDKLSELIGIYFYYKNQNITFATFAFSKALIRYKESINLYFSNDQNIQNECQAYINLGTKLFLNHLMFLREQKIDDLIDFFYSLFQNYKNQISYYFFYSFYKSTNDSNNHNDFKMIQENVARLTVKFSNLKYHHRLIGVIFLNLFNKIVEGNIRQSLAGRKPLIPNKNFIENIVKKLEYNPE